MQLDTIGGYRIIARLGRGGMADVFLAARTGLVGFSRLTVVKRLRHDMADDPRADRYRALLLDEARIAARLRHPNIVQTFEVGEHAGQPFLAMEYLEGQPVSQVLMRAHRLGLEIPAQLSLQVVAQTLTALDYAHQLTDYDGSPLGVVHRDVSPQNIFWTYAGEVKLVDFGIAKFAFGRDETETGMLKGKLGYMAPEQARGDELDGRADVFAAGVVLWELITGRRMLRAKSQAAQLHMLLFEELPPLHAVKPDADARIARICDRALERDPARRYASATAMRDDIEHVLGDLRPRREALAAFVEPLFAEDRQEVAEQIRSAMSGDHRASLITLSRAEPSTSYLEIEIVKDTPTVVARASVPPVPPVPVKRQRFRTLAMALTAGIALVLAAIVAVWTQPGTTARAAPAIAAEPAAAPGRDPRLRLCGSNTIGAELGPAIVEAFLRKRGSSAITRTAGAEPGHTRISGTIEGESIVVDVSASGTSTAFQALAAGACDVGMASRAIHADEAAAGEQAGLGDLRAPASEHVLALDGIAVVVHRNNPLRDLDRDTLRGVFTGAITDWSQLGGSPGPIRVLARDHHSGTFDTFKALVLGKAELRADAARFEQSAALADAVAADPGAIGFIGLPYIRGTKALAIGDRGAPPRLPSAFTITTEGYLLSRRLYLYIPAQPRSPLVTELISFALSAQGQEVVREVGFVDLELVASDRAPCDARCPRRYAGLVEGAHRLSVDFRFRHGRDEPDSRATRDLDRVVQYLARHPGSQILLFGFSDSSGSPLRNLTLSRLRAAAIARELATRGVTAAAVDGFGAALPVAGNGTELDRERNRRVEVWVRAL
jgi:phosphate transport system substrate-binding protein